MSLFNKLAAGARAAHNHFFGSDVYLTSQPGATPTLVDAVLGRETVETRREDNRDVRYLVRECRFLSITSVRHDAVVTIDGLLYSIDHIEGRQASGLTVKLQRTTVTESNRPQYRGKG